MLLILGQIKPIPENKKAPADFPTGLWFFATFAIFSAYKSP
jgi:hypothetical protein